MRLDFRNIGKGLEAVAGAKQKRDLARESARYDITEGAYGPELGENIEQLRGLQAQDPAQAAIYDQSIQELERRRGLTAPDFSVGSREANFGTRQEARQAAAPMRAEGLANVYRQYGDVEDADQLEARAFEQQRGLARETREQERFKTQQEAADLQLGKARREAEADTRMGLFDTWTAENPGADLAAIKNAAKEFKLSSDQVLGVTARMAGLQENELKLWKGEVQNLLKGRSDAEIVDLFNKDDRFDPSTDMERKVGKDGSVTLTLKRKDGTVVSTYKAPDAATATAYLRKQALEPEALADWLLDRKKTEAQIGASQAAAAASGRERGPRQMSEAEVTARAKALFESGEAQTFTEALQIARQGEAYVSPVDRLIADMAAQREAEQKKKAAETPGPAAAGPRQGLFRDPQGRVQLLQPFTNVNQMRQRMVDEENARDAASGFSMGNVAP